jgi:Fe(II)/alpha-ketoglutarate-dependent arginine beta-hydroxylase
MDERDHIFILNECELAQVEQVVTGLAECFDTVESQDFAEACELAVADLPKRLRAHMNRMASGQSRDGFLTIQGFPIDDDRLGNSPSSWDVSWAGQPFLREEIYQCVMASTIGSIFGWRTQENGRFLRHIVPIETDKDEQLGGSSTTALLYHIEEAFHPARADYLCLMCYRNTERARTELVSVDDLELQPEVEAVLRQERFIVDPDKSHLPAMNKSEHWAMDPELFHRIRAIVEEPKPCAVMYGSASRPMMLVDEAFMRSVPGDAEAAAALTAFHSELTHRARAVTMRAGELLFIDNKTVAHGRSIYKPNYGPKHRWLRRVNISNGQRVSAEFQERDNHRVRV